MLGPLSFFEYLALREADCRVHDAAGTRLMLQGTTDGDFFGVGAEGHGTDNMVRAMGEADMVGGWEEFAQHPTVHQKDEG